MEVFLGVAGFVICLCLVFPRFIPLILGTVFLLIGLAVFALFSVVIAVFLPMFGIPQSGSAVFIPAAIFTLIFIYALWRSNSKDEQAESVPNPSEPPVIEIRGPEPLPAWPRREKSDCRNRILPL